MEVLFVGDDWSEDHHDVCLMDPQGQVLAARRLPEGVEGLQRFHVLVGEYVEVAGGVVIGIETDQGMWVQALIAAGYQVFAINPGSVSRYRDRHRIGGGKSDTSDAKMLADVVRTDRHNHRTVAANSELSEAVKVLARAHQNLIWARSAASNALRATLRQYYPGALLAFSDLDDRDTLAVLERAPDPDQGARLSRSVITAALRRGGRQRNLDRRAGQIQAALRVPQPRTTPVLQHALATVTGSQVAILAALNTQIAELATELGQHFEQHPDAAIYLSLPGLGEVLGARMLGEFGDDPNRYANHKSRRNYAGTSPLTVASGRKKTVHARHLRNKRLADTTHRWAFAALLTSPGARACYQRHRDAKEGHYQALRAVANKLVSCLHACLRDQTLYDETIAWQNQPTSRTTAA